MLIEYVGTNYSGWQMQKIATTYTIQEKIQDAIEKILQEKVKLIGAARTDSGVHAKGQVANFKIENNIDLRELKRALNAVLPDDIVIIKAEDAGLKFDSRRSSRSKLYEYKILNRDFYSAFTHPFNWCIPYALNVGAMQEGAIFFIGEHNFSSFCASGSSRENKNCKILSLEIEKKDDYIILLIEGTNFLYKMVRNIVGTLVEIGRGRFASNAVKDILTKQNRKYAGPTAPAKGLTLFHINY